MPGFELIGKEERKAVNELFDDGGVLFAHGFDNMRNNRYHVREFEENFSEYLGVKYSQAVSSGTAALKIALLALGVRPGDEVITQTFTFIATAEAIIDIGAKPVFVNIDETLNMNPNELESSINTILSIPILRPAAIDCKFNTLFSQLTFLITISSFLRTISGWFSKMLSTSSGLFLLQSPIITPFFARCNAKY